MPAPKWTERHIGLLFVSVASACVGVHAALAPVQLALFIACAGLITLVIALTLHSGLIASISGLAMSALSIVVSMFQSTEIDLHWSFSWTMTASLVAFGWLTGVHSKSVSKAVIFQTPTDQVTAEGSLGLLNKDNFIHTLEDDLSRGKQIKYPVSFIVFTLDFSHSHLTYSDIARARRSFVRVVESETRDIDTAFYEKNLLGVSLPGSTFEDAENFAQRINKGLAKATFANRTDNTRHSLASHVTFTSAIVQADHDSTAMTLLNRAYQRIDAAEVAASDAKSVTAPTTGLLHEQRV